MIEWMQVYIIEQYHRLSALAIGGKVKNISDALTPDQSKFSLDVRAVIGDQETLIIGEFDDGSKKHIARVILFICRINVATVGNNYA